MKILIATGNPHKLKELTNMLPAKLKNGTPIEYVSLADFNGLVLPPETGSTLEDKPFTRRAKADCPPCPTIRGWK